MIKPIHLYIAGTGLVGSALIKQIQKQTGTLLCKEGIDIRVMGIANSKKMLIQKTGISLHSAQTQLINKGVKTNIDEFIKTIKTFKLKGSVFVDCTASSYAAKWYESAFAHSFYRHLR